MNSRVTPIFIQLTGKNNSGIASDPSVYFLFCNAECLKNYGAPGWKAEL